MATASNETYQAQGTALPGMRQFGMIAGVLGVILAVAGFFMSGADRFFQAYLVAYTFWMGVVLGSLALLMVQHLSGGVWGLVLRRPFEAAVRTIPVMALLFIPIVFGMHSLYEWSHEGITEVDAVIREKALYLNTPFFLARQVLYFASWILLGTLLTKWSAEQDRTGDPALLGKLSKLSGGGLLVYGYTMTFAMIDWTMSVNPHWFSTIWGLLYLGGQGLSVQAGGAGQVLQGGPGVVQPGEHQRLREGGAGQLALAPDEAGLAGGLVGLGGEKRLQGVRQLCYGGGHGKLLGHGVVANTMLRRSFPIGLLPYPDAYRASKTRPTLQDPSIATEQPCVSTAPG